MGSEPEETLKDIEQRREAIAEKVDALAGQLRSGVDRAAKRGLAVAGLAVAALAGLITLKRRRKR